MTNVIPCLYAIVRFSPFIETGEFANVGIVLLAPKEGLLLFKLMRKRHARISNFFDQLRPQVFANCLQNLQEELKRLQKLVQQGNGGGNRTKFGKQLFEELTRSRETMIRFGEVGAILSEGPLHTLDELYAHYVERDFINKEYQEAVLERSLRKWISQTSMKQQFRRADIGNDEYHAAFPFVSQLDGKFYKAIKPLDLQQDQPSKILDHGGMWLFKVATLRRKQLLPPHVLFAVQGPMDDSPRGNAYREIVGEMRDVGVQVLPFAEKSRILTFIQTP